MKIGFVLGASYTTLLIFTFARIVCEQVCPDDDFIRDYFGTRCGQHCCSVVLLLDRLMALAPWFAQFRATWHNVFDEVAFAKVIILSFQHHVVTYVVGTLVRIGARMWYVGT